MHKVVFHGPNYLRVLILKIIKKIKNRRAFIKLWRVYLTMETIWNWLLHCLACTLLVLEFNTGFHIICKMYWMLISKRLLYILLSQSLPLPFLVSSLVGWSPGHTEDIVPQWVIPSRNILQSGWHLQVCQHHLYTIYHFS